MRDVLHPRRRRNAMRRRLFGGRRRHRLAPSKVTRSRTKTKLAIAQEKFNRHRLTCTTCPKLEKSMLRSMSYHAAKLKKHLAEL